MRQTAGAIADLTRSIQLSDRVPARTARAYANAFAGQFDRALEDWDFVVRNSSDPAAALSGRAGLLLQLGRLDAVLADANAALRINPADVDALGHRAFIATSRRQYGEAKSDLDRAITIAPDDPRILQLRAQLLASEGKVEQAIAAYDSAIAKHPVNSALLSGRIAALQAAGEFSRGQADCELLLTLEPDDGAPFLRVDAPTVCAVLALNFGKYDSGTKYFSRAIAAARGPVPHLYVFRGLARAFDGKIPSALLDLDRAIELDQKAPNAHLMRGIVRWSVRRDPKAADDLDAAISNEPGSTRAIAILWLAQIDQSKANLLAKRYLVTMSVDERRTWPWPLVAFFQNGSTRSEIGGFLASYLPAARESPKSCDFPFFSAMFDKTRTAPAKFNSKTYLETMRALSAICPPASVEALGAWLEAARAS